MANIKTNATGRWDMPPLERPMALLNAALLTRKC